MYKGHKVAVVIPALNEEKAISSVVHDLLSLAFDKLNVIDSVVVCDNGSTDDTANVARAAGAIVTKQSMPGYGIACLSAIAKLPACDIVLFVDGDDSCFIEQAILLLNGIVDGDDLAIGSRTLGHIEPGCSD